MKPPTFFSCQKFWNKEQSLLHILLIGILDFLFESLLAVLVGSFEGLVNIDGRLFESLASLFQRNVFLLVSRWVLVLCLRDQRSRLARMQVFETLDTFFCFRFLEEFHFFSFFFCVLVSKYGREGKLNK